MAATTPINRLFQQLRKSVIHDGAGRTDGQLLDLFVHHKDDAALTALVRRHGPMVWGVCCRLLRSHHDAEDAFQATFLVLFQKAATLPDKEMVGNWLYGVAHQTAVRMRAIAAKRGVRERQVAVMPEPTSAEQYVWNDLQSVLDEELCRLPDKYRVLIVLCNLEDKTRKEVAVQLGIPEGTVASRLATARTMLAKRLARRGVVVSGVLLGTLLTQRAASACVPMTVISSTIKAATLVAAGQGVAAVASPTVAALLSGVTKMMFVTKIKSVSAVLLAVLFFCGAAVTMYQTQAADQPQEQKPMAKAKGGKAEEGNDKTKDALAAVVYLDIEYEKTLVRGSAVGVVVDGRRPGYILSVYAPLKGAYKVRVAFGDGRILDAHDIIPTEADTGIAVVIMDKNLPEAQRVITFADPKNVKVKEAVSIIRPTDDAGGKGKLISLRGVVSAMDREVKLGDGQTLKGLIQVDQRVEAGSPVLNTDGELLGICLVPSKKGQSLGFVIPSDRLKAAYEIFVKSKRL